jgi:hypothetical protein
MNERIKSLMQQVGTDTSGKWMGVEHAEKLVELIVKECLSIVEPTEDSNDEWCVTLKGTAQEIKEHFGVEE